ncbi:uncharacterized protein LOC116987967 isoform X2 [Amblyraja radiata]|uniref:uncharacterized protein LOC116987967 isoform X2 n=1 Tax=Amblyraja radiata TaxID=386614 RepID=UPI001403EB93|nr:uncharacterized protein LOC116987967 isoform X2 [Amblyraja radiata]
MFVVFHLQVLFVLTPFAACQGHRVPASNPEISAQIGFKMEKSIITTIFCLSPKGSLPINYTLYRDTTLVMTYVAESRRKAEFIVNLSFSELLDILKCKADNGFGPKYSRGLIIDLSVNLTSKPDPPILGQQLALSCAVTYETQEHYKWYFVYPAKNTTEVTQQNQYIIKSANVGIYYCSVYGYFSNRIEVLAQDLSVNLTSKPDPPIVGQQLALYCTVTYDTKESYTWYFVYPTKNMTKDTEQNQFIIEAANSGIYYCSVHGHFSNRIEVPEQDSSFQPVVVGVSVGAILLLILIIGLICYCSATKAHRLNIG